MAVSTSINGVTIYNLSAGKILPNWVAEKQRKIMNKDMSYRRRIEVLQDLAFPQAAQTIHMSNDGRYVVATGTYPPRVRVYDTSELSMKFERYMDATPVAVCPLSDGYSKLAFLQDDRNVEVHAAYGKHYKTRIPRAGRCMVYHQARAELLVGASDSEVYRLSLEDGRFMAPLQTSSTGVNAIAISRVSALIGVACEQGKCEFFDPRSCTRASILDLPAGNGKIASSLSGGGGGVANFDATCLAFEEGGMGFLVGTSDGRALLYDLRHGKPTVVRSHPYGLPLVDVRFHRGASEKLILSTDAKQCRIWRKDGGSGRSGNNNNSSSSRRNSFSNINNSTSSSSNNQSNFVTAIEAPAKINAVAVASDDPSVGGFDSGLLFFAGEQERVMTYYVPTLGVAPKWASFIDSVTEELEEKDGELSTAAAAAANSSSNSSSTNNATTSAVFDDYRFVTPQELSQLGLTHLVGTALLKPYMHGFFIDSRLHSKVRAVLSPEAVDAWRKARVTAAVEADRGSRIAIQDSLPKVNKELALRLQQLQQENLAKNIAKQQYQQQQQQQQQQSKKGGVLSSSSTTTSFSSSSATASANGKEEEETGRGKKKQRHNQAMGSSAYAEAAEEEEDSSAIRKRSGGASVGIGGSGGGAVGAGGGAGSSILTDSRFSSLFTDEAFAIDADEAAIVAARRGSAPAAPTASTKKTYSSSSNNSYVAGQNAKQAGGGSGGKKQSKVRGRGRDSEDEDN